MEKQILRCPLMFYMDLLWLHMVQTWKSLDSEKLYHENQLFKSQSDLK